MHTLTRDRTHNLGTYPDGESNPQHFGAPFLSEDMEAP